MMSPSPSPTRLLQEVGTPSDAPSAQGRRAGQLCTNQAPARLTDAASPSGLFKHCGHKLGRILNSTFLIKRSSFLRQVFFFPSYFNRKYFFILDPTQVTQEIQAFSRGANVWEHLACRPAGGRVGRPPLGQSLSAGQGAFPSPAPGPRCPQLKHDVPNCPRGWWDRS